MQEKRIKEMLLEYKKGHLSLEESLEFLKDLPFEDLGFAKVDHHRELRQNSPEVIYCPGKTYQQIEEIFLSLAKKSENILATRAEEDVYLRLKEKIDGLEYFPLAKIILLKGKIELKNEDLILVVSAGTADLRVAEEARITAEVLGNRVESLYDVGVAGIHRLLSYYDLLRKANVIIVVAGMEGALASVVGGLVERPVIAVPTSIGYGANFKGLSALLAMLNSCASGVGVVNIDNGFGAACLADKINTKK